MTKIFHVSDIHFGAEDPAALDWFAACVADGDFLADSDESGRGRRPAPTPMWSMMSVSCGCRSAIRANSDVWPDVRNITGRPAFSAAG